MNQVQSPQEPSTDVHKSTSQPAPSESLPAEDAHDSDHAQDTHPPLEAHAHELPLTPEVFLQKPWLERLELAKAHYFDLAHLLGHVQDSNHIELPRTLGGKWEIPNPLGRTAERPLIGTADKPIIVGQLTKFMLLELLAALILCTVFIWFARKLQRQDRPRGAIANTLETIVVFIRDEIAVPCIGSKDANRYLPFLLTLFFFVLTLNLLGILPWLGAATGALAVTGVLALTTFAVVLFAGIKKLGLVGFLKAQVPHMDLPKPMAIALIPTIWLIEMFGFFIKHGVLALRLFANMFAGHLVLAVFVAFIGVTASTWLVYGVTPIVLIGSVLFCVLEVLVVFLQAYIFTFLAAIFIGSARHAH